MVSDRLTSNVLILGAGVHGAAIARELVRRGVGVQVVDKFDVAYGATSKSSRLIHGGLRYLEYGDFHLVRESLQARERQLQLAPQFVQPLRLFIPTSKRGSGLLRASVGFLGGNRTAWGRRWTQRRAARGFWPVRMGLMVYDLFSGSLPKSSSVPVGAPGTPRVNPERYRWLCAYSDAQMLYPERLVVELLADAQEAAAKRGVSFQITTYASAEHRDGQWRLHDSLAGATQTLPAPACVVNATGAWGDATLEQLRIESPRLFGGTKGTHFLTWNEELIAALGGQAVYAEADDGRLVFILPFGDGVLVGTTDETFAASPETAAATEEELDYLLGLVNDVMDCRLTRGDITAHYSGIRPLPSAAAGDNAAVSREHHLVEHRVADCPILTLVGGKLTTWEDVAHEVSNRVLNTLGVSRTRQLTPLVDDAKEPDFPKEDAQRIALWQSWSVIFDAPLPLIADLWPLYGLRTADVLAACEGHREPPIHGTALTPSVVRWIIEQEWVRTLSDLVERRLMLALGRHLAKRTLSELTDCLIAAGRLDPAHAAEQITSTMQRLTTYYGRRWD